MLPSWSQWLGLAALSGAAAAVVNLIGSWLVGRQSLKAQKARQDAEHAHQRRMLSDVAHFDARAEAAERAAGALSWIEYRLITEYGMDTDLHPDQVPTPAYAEAADVIQAAYVIRDTHPTKAVRDIADRLASDLFAGYNTINADGGMQKPGKDDLVDWYGHAKSLAEAIQTPPSPGGSETSSSISVN